MNVQLRAEIPQDEVFLQRLIAETVALELGADRWPEPMRSQLLSLQIRNRRMGPRTGFPQGESLILVTAEEAVGWIFLANLDDTIHIVEIMVLPAHRSRGIGAGAVREVLGRASVAGKTVTLTVNVLNAGAIRLYERLGFRRIDGNEVQHEMEARP